MPKSTVAALATDGGSPSPEQEQHYTDYWYSLISEDPAAEFLDVVPRSMQGWRQRGEGPPFVRISSRCIKYRRIDLRAWAEARLRNSTADPGQAAGCRGPR